MAAIHKKTKHMTDKFCYYTEKSEQEQLIYTPRNDSFTVKCRTDCYLDKFFLPCYYCEYQRWDKKLKHITCYTSWLHSASISNIYFPTNAHNVKNVELLKHFKIRKLLQHVSVYKETIIREPQPVLSSNYTLGSKWIRRARTRRQCYGCIL